MSSSLGKKTLISQNVKHTSNSSLLQQKIKILKNEIQELINNPDYETLKNDKMTELENLTVQLKKTRLNNEYNKISRITDSMEYSRLKNKSNSVELLTNIKDKREKAKEEFEKIKEINDKYSEIEDNLFKQTNLHIPGFLFFHKDILDNYGICPHLNLTSSNDNESITPSDQTVNNNGIILDEGSNEINIMEKRSNWLNQQYDGGKLYKDLYDKIINKSSYEEYIDKLNEYNIYFENMHRHIFTESQKKLFEDSVSYLQEYVSHSIKTKKLKEKFKIIINNISILVMETGVNIHSYLHFKMNVDIPINDLKTIHFDKDKNINIGIVDDYNQHLQEYSMLKENIINSNRYVNNVTNELKYNLSQYLYNQSFKTKVIKYIGKYFKKWSLLSDNEKIERLEYFSDYFVQKYLVNAKLLERTDGQTKIDELSKILIDAYKSKLLKYKYIKWNANTGVIEKIFALKYNDNTKEFFLDIKNEKETHEEKSKENVDEYATCSQDSVTEESQSTFYVKEEKAAQKSVSLKTIFNKANEKIINEEILVFIVKNKNKCEDLTELKDKFHEIIKLKLKLKRLNTHDKQKMFVKFDEIFNVIKNNSYY